MNKDYICMLEDVKTTQKKIKQWTSIGYNIEIIHQKPIIHNNQILILTSLWRIEDD